LEAANLPSHHLPVTSRYYPVGTAKLEVSGEEAVVYLRRRFIPPPEHYTSQQSHIVSHGERPDTVTAIYLEDPEQFWQLADANVVMKPQELTAETGRILRIPGAAGISEY